ncbi:hypothetical protein [Methylotenera sp.]|uniref:hypothetical protein n=1 Tax=Methylotenera sp. TaxID=2051956 RepID=UPI002ED89D34
MKKSILVAAILTTMSIAAMAEDSTNVKLDVIVINKGIIVNKTTISAPYGVSTPIEITKTSTYRAQATRNGQGEIITTPGEIKTGLLATFNPTLEKDGKIKTNIAITYTDLIAMKKIKTEDGLEVEFPELNNHEFTQENATLKQGEPNTMQAGSLIIQVKASSI